jgi:Carbohydrate esterase, sialic acid-specific acetylesterase
MTTFNKIVALLCFAFCMVNISFAQTINQQNQVYGKYIGSKLSEKYRISSEDAPGVSANSLVYTNNGYGLAAFSYPFDGSVIQRNGSSTTSTATTSIAGKIDKALIDNGFTNFTIILTALNVTTGAPLSGATGYVWSVALNSPPENQVVGNLGVFNLIKTINQGWYNMQLQGTKNGINYPLTSIKFGVGDVFIIAGQSNARGVQNQGATDNVISYHNDGATRPDGVRILQATRPTFSAEKNFAFELSGKSYSENLLKRIRLENGLPHFRKFDRLDYLTYAFKTQQLTTVDGIQNGTIQFNNYEQIIFPFGGASWAYMPLGKLWVNNQNVPVAFFNFAINSSSINFWQKNYTGQDPGFENNFTVLRKFLNFQGKYNGFKAILWYQGEIDITENMTQTDHTLKLNQMMSDMATETGLSINWFISKVSYSINFDATFSSKSSTIIPAAQTASAVSMPSKKFIGVDDAASPATNSAASRGSGFNIHYTGANLNTLGSKWYNAINANLVAASPTVYLGLYSVGISHNAGNNTYTLTAPTTTLFNEYRWVKDEGDIENAAAYTTGNTKTVSAAGLADREVYTCFMRLAGQKSWAMCAPFIVPNIKDQESNIIVDAGKSFDKNSINDMIRINTGGVTWFSSVIYNQGSGWVALSGDQSGASGQYNLNYNLTVNNSGAQRIAIVRLTGQNILGTSIVKDYTMTQSNTSLTTPLTNLTPTTASGTYRLNKSNDNNTMKVNNVLYTNISGFGVQATNNLYWLCSKLM